MNSSGKVFVLSALTFVVLLLCYFLPEIRVGGSTLRQVDVLGDLEPHTVPTTVSRPKSAHRMVAIEDYAHGQAGGMAHFYGQLARIQSLGRPVRIAYYGDSFVGGDLMLGDLRQLLQQQFGGCGAGWIDPASTFNAQRITMRIASEGVTAHSVLDPEGFHAAWQGLSQSYCDLMPNATLRLSNPGLPDYDGKWNRVSVLLRVGSTVTVKADPGGQRVLAPSKRVQVATFDTPGCTRMTVTLQGTNTNSRLHGIALEDERGIVIDNLAMQGASGMDLVTMSDQMLADVNRLRPYDLVVLHFGLNVVPPKGFISPHICARYKRAMKQVIAKLRRAFPGVSILLVSVTDSEGRQGSEMATLPGVEQLLDLQRRMAKDNQVAFYNLYEAMGGRGSIKRLIGQGLAEKDYHHINFKGGRLIARRFYNSIMQGYRAYTSSITP